MGFAQWMRVIDAASGLVHMAGRLRRPGVEQPGADLAATGSGGGPLGQIEARLAGVVVAALKEAFDRDSARLELERSQIEAERQRAEEALRAELRRQAGERALNQLRLVATMAVGIWALSAALSVLLPGMGAGVPRALLGGGWAMVVGALGCTFAAWPQVSRWSADMRDGAPGAPGPSPVTAAAAPWLMLAALAFVGASLLVAL